VPNRPALTPAITEHAEHAFLRALPNDTLSSADLIHLESIILPALRRDRLFREEVTIPRAQGS
jgi:hypothetical protein